MHNVPRSLITETLVKSKLFSENKKRKDYLKNKITLVKKSRDTELSISVNWPPQFDWEPHIFGLMYYHHILTRDYFAGSASHKQSFSILLKKRLSYL